MFEFIGLIDVFKKENPSFLFSCFVVHPISQSLAVPLDLFSTGRFPSHRFLARLASGPAA
jgi:hypothetical protein